MVDLVSRLKQEFFEELIDPSSDFNSDSIKAYIEKHGEGYYAIFLREGYETHPSWEQVEKTGRELSVEERVLITPIYLGTPGSEDNCVMGDFLSVREGKRRHYAHIDYEAIQQIAYLRPLVPGDPILMQRKGWEHFGGGVFFADLSK